MRQGLLPICIVCAVTATSSRKNFDKPSIATEKSFCNSKGVHSRSKQCLCIYKAPCLARACWAQPKPVVLRRADAGFAFLQNALSALCKSAQPSRFRDVHRDWGCIPTSRIRTANLQCHACLSLCIYRGTACYNGVGSEKFTASELYRCPNLSYNEDVLRERSIA